MGKLFWIIIGIMGLVLIALVSSGNSGQTFGFETAQVASLSAMALWAILIGGITFGNGVQLIEKLKQLVLWVIIIMMVTAAYILRYDFQDIGARLTGGLIPGSPISRHDDSGKTIVTLIRADNGHFQASAQVNGTAVDFLVDTGATAIVLSAEDAQNAGINPSDLAYTIATQTANGRAYSALARINSFSLGGIERQNIKVLVSKPGQLNQSLLGQQFLESLSSYEKRGDRLILRD